MVNRYYCLLCDRLLKTKRPIHPAILSELTKVRVTFSRTSNEPYCCDNCRHVLQIVLFYKRSKALHLLLLYNIGRPCKSGRRKRIVFLVHGHHDYIPKAISSAAKSITLCHPKRIRLKQGLQKRREHIEEIIEDWGDGFIDSQSALDACNRGNPAYKLKVKPSRVIDSGTITEEFISKGKYIVEYTGNRVSPEEADRREAFYNEANMFRDYMFSLPTANCVIDATMGGSAAWFINHCCERNVEAVCTKVGKEWKVFIVSLKDLSPQEELLLGYKMNSSTLQKKQKCLCNAPSCKGTF